MVKKSLRNLDSSLSVIKEINLEYSLEGLMLRSFNTLTTWWKEWLIWKDPHAGKDWTQEEKGTTEDKMAVWHYWLNGCEFEQALGDGEGQGSLACISSHGHKDLYMT